MAHKPDRSHSSQPNDADTSRDDASNFSAIREPLGAPSPQARASRDDDNTEDNPDGGAEPLAWQRRLSARGKLWRGSLVGVVIAITCVVILAHAPLSTFPNLFPSNTPASNHATPTAFPISDLTSFQLTPVPTASAHNLTMAVAVANDLAQTAYACWSADPVSPESHMGRIYFAYHHTTDNGYAWTPLAIPLAYAYMCALTLDSTNPEGVLVSLNTGSSPCDLPLLYYSADGGAHWTQITWPTTTVAACNLHMALVGGRFYAWDDASLLPPDSSRQLPTGRIITSLLGAEGATQWMAADNGLSDLAVVSVIGMRPGGGLLAVGDLASGGATRTLLASTNDGQTWNREGALPGLFPQVFVSSNPYDVAHNGWGRLYLQAYTSHSEANGQGAMFLATAYLGDGWSPLPLPPPSTTTEMNIGAPTVIGVGTDDSLLATRGAISQNIATPGPPAEHLWLWQSEHQRWLLNRDPTPANTVGLSASWAQGQTTLWFTVLDPDVEPTIYLLSATFASQPPGAQPVAGG